MTKTLLEQAKEHKTKPRTSTQQERELTIAWIKGEITNAQVSTALTSKPNQTVSLYKIAFAIRDLYQEGKITVK